MLSKSNVSEEFPPIKIPRRVYGSEDLYVLLTARRSLAQARKAFWRIAAIERNIPGRWFPAVRNHLAREVLRAAMFDRRRPDLGAICRELASDMRGGALGERFPLSELDAWHIACDLLVDQRQQAAARIDRPAGLPVQWPFVMYLPHVWMRARRDGGAA